MRELPRRRNFRIHLETNQTIKVTIYSNVAVRSGKKSPNQETGLVNKKVLNYIKLVLNEHK